MVETGQMDHWELLALRGKVVFDEEQLGCSEECRYVEGECGLVGEFKELRALIGILAD